MLPTPIDISWWDIIKLAVGAGTTTAILNNLLGWLRDWQKETGSAKRDARYLAIRIAAILDAFAIQCANYISDNQMYSHAEGHAGRYHGALPPLADYPADADWKLLDPALADRILILRNELILADGAIQFWEDVDRDCIPTACDDQSGKCGYRAWQLASDMRRRYRLQVFDPKPTSWDVVGTLKRHHDRAIEQAREAAAA